MRRARVFVSGVFAGMLTDEGEGRYTFEYCADYSGSPVSLTMPVVRQPYAFDRFPPFFDGVLPEGARLEALLRIAKLDARDYLGQLIAVGSDLVGNVTVAGEE